MKFSTTSSSFRSVPVLFFLSCLATQSESCQVHLCSNEYSSLVAGHRELQKLQMRDIKPRTSDRLEYCNLLHAYNHCVKSLSKSCRGKLDYHAVLALVRRWIEDNNCPKTDSPLPGPNHRSRQAIRSGSFITNLSPSRSSSHQTNPDSDGDELEEESHSKEDEDDVNHEEDSHQVNNNHQESIPITEVRRRGKSSSSSHHPQCILYAPTSSASSSGLLHHNNFYTSLTYLLSIIFNVFLIIPTLLYR